MGVGAEFRALAGFKIQHIGAFRRTFMAQQILRLRNGICVEAKGLVALLAAGNGLEDEITGSAGFHRLHLGSHMGQYTNLCWDLPMFFDLMKSSQHLPHLLRRVGNRIEANYRITGAKTKALQDGCGDAIGIVCSMIGLQAAGKCPRQTDGGIAVGCYRKFGRCVNKIQIAHQFTDRRHHFRS